MKAPILAALITATWAVSPAAAEAQTLERMRETGKIILAHREDARPMSYRNAEGRVAGYAPAVCVAVAKIISELYDLSLEAEFLSVDTDSRFDAIANGEADLLCGAATITLGRREAVDFSIPVFVDGAAAVMLKGGDPDMKNYGDKTIGVRSNTTTETALNTTLGQLGVEPRIERFASHEDGMNAVLSGDIHAYFADQSLLMYEAIVSGEKDRLAVTPRPLSVEKHGLALARGDAEFRLAVDRALSRLYISGTMREIFDRAFPGAEPGAGMEALYRLAAEPE